MVVGSNTAQESRATIAAVRKHVGRHAGYGGFTVAAAYGNGKLILRQYLQHLRALQYRYFGRIAQMIELLVVFGDSRGVNHEFRICRY